MAPPPAGPARTLPLPLGTPPPDGPAPPLTLGPAPPPASVSLVNKAAVDYYFVELGLEAHFEALRHFLLMEDGEFAQSLSDLLFEKVTPGPGAGGGGGGGRAVVPGLPPDVCALSCLSWGRGRRPGSSSTRWRSTRC